MSEVKCTKGLMIQVMASPSGYYLGTETEDEDYGFMQPNCRCTDYFKTRKEAEDILTVDLLRLFERRCSENRFCNDGQGCFAKVENS